MACAGWGWEATASTVVGAFSNQLVQNLNPFLPFASSSTHSKLMPTDVASCWWLMSHAFCSPITAWTKTAEKDSQKVGHILRPAWLHKNRSVGKHAPHIPPSRAHGIPHVTSKQADAH